MKQLVLIFVLSLFLFMVTTNSGLAFQAKSGTVPQQQSSTLSPQGEKVRKQLVKIGSGKDVTVILNDEREFYGSLKSIDADTFLLFDVDGKQLLNIKYDEVKRVRKGYGHKDFITGKRISPNKALIGMIIGAAAILIPVVIVVASMSREK